MLSEQSKNSLYWAFSYLLISILINLLNLIFKNIFIISLVGILPILLGIILLIVSFWKRDYFHKGLFYPMLSIFIGINIALTLFFIQTQLNIPHEKIAKETLNQAKKCVNETSYSNKKLEELDAKCIDKIENLSKDFENFICPDKTITDKKICYSNITFVPGEGVLIDKCDVMYVIEEYSPNTTTTSVVTAIKPLWDKSDISKHVLIDFGKKNESKDRQEFVRSVA